MRRVDSIKLLGLILFIILVTISCAPRKSEPIVTHRVSLHGVKSTIHCPGYRQPAKLMRDRNSKLVSQDIHTAKTATVGHLGGLSVPGNITGHSPRHPGAETHLWKITARVGFIHLESDGDAHIELVGLHGKTMVAEAASPLCLKITNPFYREISKARSEAVRIFGPTLTARPINLWVKIVGPLFWDELGHGQGHATNGAEIHPLFSIRVSQSLEKK